MALAKGEAPAAAETAKVVAEVEEKQKAAEETADQFSMERLERWGSEVGGESEEKDGSEGKDDSRVREEDQE